MNNCNRFNILSKLSAVLLMVLGSLAAAPNTSHAQEPNATDWQEYVKLIGEAHNLASAGDVKQASEAAQKLIAHLQRRFPPRLQLLGIYAQGKAYEVQAKYSDALDQYQQFLKEAKDFQPRIETERIVVNSFIGMSLQNSSYCLSQLARYEEAVPFAQASVDWRRKHDAEHPLVAAEAEKQMAFLFRDMRDYDRAERHFQQAAAVYEQAYRREQKPITGYPHLLIGLASIQENRDRFDLAEPLYRRALTMQLALKGWQHSLSAEIAESLAAMHFSQGRYEEARPYAEAALAVWENLAGEKHITTMIAVRRIAMLHTAQGREDEAVPLMRRIAAVYEEVYGADHPATGGALIDLGLTLVLAKKYDEAELSIQEGLEILKAKFGENNPRIGGGLHGLAILKLKQDNPNKALLYLDQLAAIYALHPPGPSSVAGTHRFRAEALWALKDRPAAVKELQLALDGLELQRGNASGAERERASYLAIFAPEFESMIQWQAEMGNMPELFRAVESMKARSFLDELRLKGADLLEGASPAQRQQLAKHENDLRTQLGAAERQFEAVAHITPQAPAAEVTKREAALRQLLQARDSLYRHVAEARSSSPVYRNLVTDKSQDASLSAVQAQLRDDELMLAYAIGAYRTSHVLIIRRNSATSASLEVDQQTAKTLGIEAGPLTAPKLSHALLDAEYGIMPVLSSPKSERDIDAKLATLWQVLVPEKERQELTTGKIKLLTIIPDGPLALLPFEALVVTPGDADSRAYLLDVGPPISYAPSAAVLLNLAKRERVAAKGNQSLLTLGDPAYPPATGPAPAATRQVAATTTEGRFRAGLARLPYTGSESIWVEQLFEKAGQPGVRLTGAAATEAAIRQYSPGREIIHLACHGMSDQTYGNFFGALAIAPGKQGDSRDDGFLTMSEIYELDLTGCELAILSACETNYGPHQQGEGVWALSRGFLVAGSRRVVASNWVVDDRAGATLVSYFASYLTKAGKDPAARDYAAALHSAKQLVRKVEKWRHPFYWSSLVLVGPK